MKKFYLISLLLVTLILNSVVAQQPLSKTPPSLAYGEDVITELPIHDVLLKTNDFKRLKAEDEEHIKDGRPMRVAIGVKTNLEMNDESGKRFTLPTGEKIWMQAIRSEDSKGLILSFDELYIPEGGVLYIYTADGKKCNVFTHETNPSGGVFASRMLHENVVVMEYVESQISDEKPQIKLSGVGCVYKSASALGDDLTCFINVNCPEGANWQKQKQGVVGLWIQMSDGWYICSGSLVNNVKQDKTPYILTATHCIDGYNATTLQTMEFDFFKEGTDGNCLTTADESSLTKTLVGATLIAKTPSNRSSDGTLLKLTSPIPADWSVYYNGWDATGGASASGVGIHHPNSLVKKISTYTSPLRTVSNVNIDDGVYTGTNTHWEVKWVKTVTGHSVTYGGSSGSPIFNPAGLIVGTLTAGGSYCEDPNQPDYYGKVSYHWDGYTTDANQHFKKYLDPDNTGVKVFYGYDPMTVFGGTPVATDATDINISGFTANWVKSDGASKYFLDVYYENNSQKIYADGYKSRYVGDAQSFVVTGLKSNKEYKYVIRAGAESSMSTSSNEILAKTLKAPFDQTYPEAFAATNISKTSFDANWEAVDDATSYLLNVYQKQGGDEQKENINFSGSLPIGWKTNCTMYYSSAGNFGMESPALRMDNNPGTYIESKTYDGIIVSVNFWYKGMTTDNNSYLTISGSADGSNWTEIRVIKPLAKIGTVISITDLESSLFKTIKFVYTKAAGNFSIDDIEIVSGSTNSTIEYLDGFQSKDIGNVTTYAMTDLQPFQRYYYSVIGKNNSGQTQISNEVRVLTTDQTPVETPKLLLMTIWSDKSDIYINSKDNVNADVAIYSITGQLIAKYIIAQGNLKLSRANIPAGIYLVKVNQETHKIILR